MAYSAGHLAQWKLVNTIPHHSRSHDSIGISNVMWTPSETFSHNSSRQPLPSISCKYASQSTSVNYFVIAAHSSSGDREKLPWRDAGNAGHVLEGLNGGQRSHRGIKGHSLSGLGVDLLCQSPFVSPELIRKDTPGCSLTASMKAQLILDEPVAGVHVEDISPPDDVNYKLPTSYKLLLRRYASVREEIQPWSDHFMLETQRRPTLQDVSQTRVDWLRNKFKEYVWVRSIVENLASTDTKKEDLYLKSRTSFLVRFAQRKGSVPSKKSSAEWNFVDDWVFENLSSTSEGLSQSSSSAGHPSFSIVPLGPSTSSSRKTPRPPVGKVQVQNSRMKARGRTPFEKALPSLETRKADKAQSKILPVSSSHALEGDLLGQEWMPRNEVKSYVEDGDFKASADVNNVESVPQISADSWEVQHNPGVIERKLSVTEKLYWLDPFGDGARRFFDRGN